MAFQYGYVIKPVDERFFAKTRLADNGCIQWTAGLAGEGYGYFYAGRTSKEQHGRVYAHRWAYEQFVGPIPDGLHLDHLCRNRRCVNPAHLEPVTAAENVRRSHGNNSKTECIHGHAYTPENTYIQPSNGSRSCRICRKRYQSTRTKKKAS